MLYIIQVGHNDASDRYIRNKVKAIEEAGMQATVVNLEEDCTTDKVIQSIRMCYRCRNCKAVMVQLPLPSHVDKNAVLSSIPEHRDIDGLNPRNTKYKPLTPCAIMRWLKEQKVDLEGKMVTILGRSELVGKPLANLMIDAGATVTVCNSKTHPTNRKYAIHDGDIVVSAVGKPDTISLSDAEDMLYMDDRIFIDVGINRDENGKLCGDISNEAKKLIEEFGGICTPVPGGVGKWTVRELVLRLAEMEGVEIS